MIYNIYGDKRLPINLYSNYIDSAYNLIGNNIMHELLLKDEFDAFDTNVWGCRSGGYRDWHYMPEDYSNNVYVENGELVVRNLKDYPTDEYEWSGAFVQSLGKFDFQYGMAIAEIKYPDDATNYHATWWTLGSERAGEIDIAEADNGTIWATVHWYDAENNLHSKAVGKYNINAAEYHTYVMYWNEEKITFYCDGKPVGVFFVDDATIDGVNAFKQKHYLIFNTNPYAQNAFSSTESVTNHIKYMKVYSY